MGAIVPHRVLTQQVTWSVRSVQQSDDAQVARLSRRSREKAMPWLPDLHTPAEDLAFFASEIGSSVGWVAIESDRVLGFALTRGEWLNHLYVDPDSQGAGVGSALLAEAVGVVGPGIRLWTFLRNERARDFYADHGFVEVERTDGRGNEEREPDVLLQWG
ncbi:MAG: GNAT family N-acetyltransferase [bacterium]|nr:GNAT family N-acetyltransferase [bacterium]